MLVLTRKINEKIIIGNNIEVEILDITWENVKLGITAPEEIIIDREEVHIRRKAEKLTGGNHDK